MTLVELLVCVACIAILASLLIPAVFKALSYSHNLARNLQIRYNYRIFVISDMSVERTLWFCTNQAWLINAEPQGPALP